VGYEGFRASGQWVLRGAGAVLSFRVTLLRPSLPPPRRKPDGEWCMASDIINELITRPLARHALMGTSGARREVAANPQ